jgi:hypothetical protein
MATAILLLMDNINYYIKSNLILSRFEFGLIALNLAFDGAHPNVLREWQKCRKRA